MADNNSKLLLTVAGLSFAAGVFVGWKIKTWRVKYLEAKRDFLARKSRETQEQIDYATGSKGKPRPVVVM